MVWCVCLPGVEAPPITLAALPLAAVPTILFRFHVEVVDVVDELLQRGEQPAALKRRGPVSRGNNKLTDIPMKLPPPLHY